MKKNGNNIDYPGLLLRTELKSRKITQKDFASMIDIQPSHLSEIIKGKRSISRTVAKKLEDALGISASYWIQVQARFDYEVVVKEVNDDFEHVAENILIEFNELFDMKLLYGKLGIKDKKSSDRLEFCKEELGFVSVGVQRKLMQGCFRRSEKTGLDMRMIRTWTVLAMFEASKLPSPTGRFDRGMCDEIASELSNIFNDNNNTVNRVTRTLSMYGIKFCIVEKVPHASIDGFTFFKDGVPCIVVTQRFNRIDNFAFSVLHELGHLKLHLQENAIGKVNVVDPDEESLAKEEQEANAFASSALIPETLWKQQPSVKLSNPRDLQKAFVVFAKKHRLNKWIVLGRVSFETNIFMFKSDSSREIH